MNDPHRPPTPAEVHARLLADEEFEAASVQVRAKLLGLALYRAGVKVPGWQAVRALLGSGASQTILNGLQEAQAIFSREQEVRGAFSIDGIHEALIPSFNALLEQAVLLAKVRDEQALERATAKAGELERQVTALEATTETLREQLQRSETLAEERLTEVERLLVEVRNLSAEIESLRQLEVVTAQAHSAATERQRLDHEAKITSMQAIHSSEVATLQAQRNEVNAASALTITDLRRQLSLVQQELERRSRGLVPKRSGRRSAR